MCGSHLFVNICHFFHLSIYVHVSDYFHLCILFSYLVASLDPILGEVNPIYLIIFVHTYIIYNIHIVIINYYYYNNNNNTIKYVSILFEQFKKLSK